MPKSYRSTRAHQSLPPAPSSRRRRGSAVQLPRATVAMLDAIKQRQGLRNRSQALLQLIEQKGAAAQQMT